MNSIGYLFLKLSHIMTSIFFVVSILLFSALILIKTRVWKHFKRRNY